MHLNFLDLIQVRLEGDLSVLANYMRHEYGLFEVTDSRAAADPDLVIEIIDDTVDPKRTVTVRPPVAYDSDGIFLHDPAYHVFRIDFESFGKSGYRVTCDRNFNPHFFAIIVEFVLNHLMVKKGWVFCHSSSFRFRDKVVLCPAWRNVGKTNLLLWFLLNGAQYIADDWCLLGGRGELQSLPKRMNLLYYNFREYQQLLNDLPERFVALFDFVRRSETGEYDVNQATLTELKEQARLRLSPYKTFGHEPILHPLKIDYVFLLQRSINEADTHVTTNAIERDTLVSALASILEFEQNYFHIAYIAYKGRGGKPNAVLEESRIKKIQIMEEALGNGARLNKMLLPSQSSAAIAGKRICDLIGSG
jgi:hypothetical protein